VLEVGERRQLGERDGRSGVAADGDRRVGHLEVTGGHLEHGGGERDDPLPQADGSAACRAG
jgi:hypothetical protein